MIIADSSKLCRLAGGSFGGHRSCGSRGNGWLSSATYRLPNLHNLHSLHDLHDLLAHNSGVKAVLISTYELGRQPFGLASPAAWLRRAGAEVACLDLSRQALDEAAVRAADVVAFFVPMHTATRLAVQLIEPVRRLNPRAHLCFYGLYAPVNEAYLRGLGVQSILGGEFEEGLAHLVERLGRGAPVCAPTSSAASTEGGHIGPPLHMDAQGTPIIFLARQQFLVPERAELPPLAEYAHLVLPGGEHRAVGYTEASRGCKHLCRHCPIVPVYGGVFRIVQREVVLEDIRQQVTAGARHMTFGDPDFFNGPGHALQIVRAVHREFPWLTYDVTIKIEHLRKHQEHLATLRDTGCLFVTSAVESVDNEVLLKLDKGHTRADFLRVVELFHATGLVLQPTFVPFMPWTTLEGYQDLLGVIAEHELVEAVAPIQLAIRLLIPAGSRLLELDEVRALVQPFDDAALVYPWKHADPRVDALCEEIQEIVRASEKVGRPRARTFARIWEATERALREEETATGSRRMPPLVARAAIPHLNEPWYC